ncbi:tyrosine-type recombinase/integrase [Eubacteriales bacterium OttesenSCG-928-A19]|nr:tyrosine-type recombinase/integrase [Eubacteriales bacterium OttesenSCG-928-A19]
MSQQISYAKAASQRHTQLIRELLRELPPSVSDFILSLEDQYSTLTRLAYVYDLRVFFDYLLAEVPRFAGKERRALTIDDIRAITLTDLERYPSYLTLYFTQASPDKPIENAEHGKMRKLCSLRSYYNYLFEHKHVEGNLASLVPLPKLHAKAIIRLEPNEVARMLDLAESGEGFDGRQKKYTEHTRDRDVAILTLLLGTGIRVSECVGINMDDINFEENAVLVTRKGGKEMILYFSDEVASALQQHLKKRRGIQTLPGHEEALFLSLQRRRITQRAIENLVKKYASIAAPLKRKISPHKLRSTYGTELYRSTGDIYLVADVLGHADVNTTRKHYAAMSEDHRRRAAKAVKLREE